MPKTVGLRCRQITEQQRRRVAAVPDFSGGRLPLNVPTTRHSRTHTTLFSMVSFWPNWTPCLVLRSETLVIWTSHQLSVFSWRSELTTMWGCWDHSIGEVLKVWPGETKSLRHILGTHKRPLSSNYVFLSSWIFFICFNWKDIEQHTECRGRYENPTVIYKARHFKRFVKVQNPILHKFLFWKI